MRIPLNKPKNKNVVNAIIASAWHRATNFADNIPVVASAVEPSGGAFYIETALPIGVPTGDNRRFVAQSVTARDLPLPLLWQFITDDGHKKSVVVGRIDSLEITSKGVQHVRGVFDINPYAREAERMIRSGFLRGVSADLDNFSATEGTQPFAKDEEPKKIKNKEIIIDEARLSGITVVAIPAFQEAIIRMEDFDTDPEMFEDGAYSDGELEEEMYGLVASAVPVNPPREWFQRPQSSKPVPLTIEDNGQVYGYLALWKSNHIGYTQGQKPPRSASNYQYFRTGVVRTDDGTDVTVGNLTLVGGHASMSASASEAVKHYDDTNSALVDVVAGEDQFGIWLAGSLRPGTTPEQIRAMRASALSGDWRPIDGRLELVAACFVNVPGFMTTRAMVASGQITALVAAGTQDLEEMRLERSLKDDSSVLKSLVSKSAMEEKLEERYESALSIFSEELTARREDDLNKKYENAFSVFKDEIVQEPSLDEKVLSLRAVFDS